MKEISEYTAEVFRRSEERIKERRKKRRRILTVCITFCLIAAVCSVTVIPEMLTVSDSESAGNADNSAGGDDILYGAPDGSFTQGFVSVDIKGTGENAQYQSSITDIADANNVFEQICEILVPYETDNDITENSDGTVIGGIPKEQSTGYIITLTAYDGAKRIFTLKDNCIYDTELNIEVTLTDEQMNDLKSSLKLTD